MISDVMVDLETLGNTPGCVILSIGAIGFDPVRGEIGDTYYRVINKQSCLDAGLHIDRDTEAWWRKQSPEAREVLTEAETSEFALADTLQHFAVGLIRTFGENVRIWGNGADFDNAIMAVAYRQCGIRLPWKFWNNRCYRTLKEQHPGVKLARTGTYHNALDDARTQAIHALRIFGHENPVDLKAAAVDEDLIG